MIFPDVWEREVSRSGIQDLVLRMQRAFVIALGTTTTTNTTCVLPYFFISSFNQHHFERTANTNGKRERAAARQRAQPHWSVLLPPIIHETSDVNRIKAQQIIIIIIIIGQASIK